ncbi:MAG: hypothetical protein IJR00_11425, partial [Lachnospiraceae bacterium]|nr:hypothetical protein [Lachnospiraceae bacterium]
MKWTQEELEELYRKANEKGLQDEAFAKRITENPKEALEELAGRELPEGFVLERIAGDGKYTGAYLKPNFAGGEIDLNELKSVTGGDGGFTPKVDCVEFKAKSYISIALIVSVCAAAAKVGPCPADVCGAAATCPGDVCGAAACGAEGGCVGHGCGAAASGASAGCGGAVCGAAGCGADVGCAAHG